MNRKYNSPIIVRMDDICPTMDYERFKRFSDMFDRLGVSPLLGLVPDNKDPKLDVQGEIDGYWDIIKSKIEKGWDVSMHGVYHDSVGKSKGLISGKIGKTEFAGVPYEKQIETLSYGKKTLELHGIEVDTFMPPYHSYDINTLKALNELDFKYISDGRSKSPYVLEGIKHVPANDAWRTQFSGVLTICIHSNEESEKNISDIERFLEANIGCVISFRDACDLESVSYETAYGQEKKSMFWAGKILPKLDRIIHLVKG